jgi:hypothetical protein
MELDIADTLNGWKRAHASRLRVALHGDLCDLADTVLKIRVLQSFDCGAARFPIHRRVRFAVRRPLEELFDALALHSGLAAQRLDTASLLLDGPGAFVEADGRRKPGYCSGRFDIWAESLERLDEVRARLLAVVGEQQLREEIFTVDWHFYSARLGLESVEFDEIADPDLLNEAYPMLGAPVAAFIERYLDAPEAVLILQGPPGTGKTRLVRAILAALSRRKGESAKVLYTADRRTLENDEIFVEFITGSHDAFVVEDADHVLSPRTDGNIDLHRFLAVADGVVRALGRKVIFTTNLPNVGDIDEALVRPGRCFRVVRTRGLDREETRRFLDKVFRGDRQEAEKTAEAALRAEGRSATLANVYRAIGAIGTTET